MLIEMAKRSYTLKKRAENRDETHARIVAAAAALHEELGPAQTTISAVADRAGVQRLTVYRHFADEAALFAACTAHWLDRHPLPDPARWQDIADPAEKLLTALTALYTYYRGTRRMWAASLRDAEAVPALQGPLAEAAASLADYAARLAAGPVSAGAAGPAARATLGHAVQFACWASLDAQGLDDGEMADLVLGWLGGLRPARKA
ncbi:TetR/AcrR family transcriptional regulator [Ferrovibrio xuzhouensis]|uniref:TetR/AcrR family transcriptional regulator n=1 Tax=Ferrovibrio xuzhouensis TaxID=1576914 RepID=A0ABV7VGZ3_9PROT